MASFRDSYYSFIMMYLTVFLFIFYSINDLTANNTPFRFGYDSESGAYGYIINEGGADTVIPFKTGGGGAILIGSYTGDQTIDVSSYLQSGDTVDNFIIEFVSVIKKGASKTISRPGWDPTLSTSIAAITITKTLNGNNLEISGAQAKASGACGGASITATQNIDYNIWHI